MRLNAAAFISSHNHPILVRNFTSSKQDDLKYHYIAHTSLDVIEERRAVLLLQLGLSTWLTQRSGSEF